MAARSLANNLIAPAELLAGDPRWQLANRIAHSNKLRRSHRMRELLLFITEWTLLNPNDVLREHEIGVGVFERSANYDTSGDTIVRVHIFQLRKRLKDYFETEGASEVLVVDIPKGGYTPEFNARVLISTEAPIPTARPGWRNRLTLEVGLAALSTLALGVLLGWGFRSRTNQISREPVDAFWLQMFGNHRQTELVIADTSLSVFQEMLGRNLSLAEYQGRQWALLSESVADPARRGMAKLAMTHHYTSFSETLSARNMGVIAARNGLPLELIYAREFPARDLQDKNVILGGNRRADPWMRFFEDRLNFQYEYDDEQAFGYFRNVKPQSGEDKVYRVQWDRHGFCRVAYVPNLSGTGTALILAGTDLSSAEAGERFVTSSEWISQLRNRLSLDPEARLPYFEILLKTDLAMASSPRFEIAAVRVRGKE